MPRARASTRAPASPACRFTFRSNRCRPALTGSVGACSRSTPIPPKAASVSGSGNSDTNKRAAVVDALIAVRALHVAASVAAAGALLFRLWVAAPALRGVSAVAWRERLDRQFNTIAWSSLAVVFVSAVVWLLLIAAEVSGQSLGEVLGSGALTTVLTSTRFGHVWLARVAIALALAIYLLRAKPDVSPLSPHGCAAAGLAAALLGALALAGHG